MLLTTQRQLQEPCNSPILATPRRGFKDSAALFRIGLLGEVSEELLVSLSRFSFLIRKTQEIEIRPDLLGLALISLPVVHISETKGSGKEKEGICHLPCL
jgi:hypothetical protein